MNETPSTMNNPELREDIIRRGIKRTLPVKLNRDELTDIAIAKAKKEQLVAELEDDLSAETKKRKDQIKDVEDEIRRMGRELISEHQDRIVACNDVFRAGWVHTIRTDTGKEVEKRPANAQEAQRYLPAVEGPPTNVLDQARAKQTNGANGAAQAQASQKANGVAENDDGDVVPTDESAQKKSKRGRKAKG